MQASEFPADELRDDPDIIYPVANLRDVKSDLNIKDCAEAMKSVSMHAHRSLSSRMDASFVVVS